MLPSEEELIPDLIFNADFRARYSLWRAMTAQYSVDPKAPFPLIYECNHPFTVEERETMAKEENIRQFERLKALDRK